MQQCNIFLARNDAPTANGKRLLSGWTEGYICTTWRMYRPFAQFALAESGIKPKKYLNQNIEVITTNFRAGKLDAVAIWEPTASKMVASGLPVVLQVSTLAQTVPSWLC